MLATLRSILVFEETEHSVSIRAFSEKGTVPSAVAMWWLMWRLDHLPHRWYAFDGSKDTDDSLDWLDQWTQRGWRWRKRD